MKRVKILTANELLNVLNKQWATKKDVEMIGSIGNNKAYDVIHEIKKQIEADGYKLPNNLIPMQYVIDYFKINISYLKKVAREEVK